MASGEKELVYKYGDMVLVKFGGRGSQVAVFTRYVRSSARVIAYFGNDHAFGNKERRVGLQEILGYAHGDKRRVEALAALCQCPIPSRGVDPNPGKCRACGKLAISVTKGPEASK